MEDQLLPQSVITQLVYLQPHVQNIPSHVKDTTDFEDTGNTMLVSMDVECLYTKFSNHVSIEVIKEKPNAQIDKPIARKVVTKFLFLILTLNNFIFNSISHLQRKGHAMGTVFLPSIANIFIFIKV